MPDPTLCQPTTLDAVAKVVQMLSWLVASVGGVIMAYKAVAEFQIANREREKANALQKRDLRARMADRAKLEVEALYADKKVESALHLVDVDGTAFEFTPPGAKESGSERVTHERLRHMLRSTDVTFTDLELAVRSCFDSLFSRLASMEKLSSLDILAPDDVLPPLAYYVVKLSRFKTEVSDYCNNFGFKEALLMLKRSRHW